MTVLIIIDRKVKKGEVPDFLKLLSCALSPHFY